MQCSPLAVVPRIRRLWDEKAGRVGCCGAARAQALAIVSSLLGAKTKALTGLRKEGRMGRGLHQVIYGSVQWQEEARSSGLQRDF